MKRLALSASLLALIPWSHAQTLQEFLNKVPSLPGDYCTARRAQHDEFNSKVSALLREVTKAAIEINRETEQSLKANDAEIKKRAMARAGVDPGKLSFDPEQLKKMTPEQRKQAASEMMKQATGMSLEDLKKLQQVKLPENQVANQEAALANTGIDPEAMKKLNQLGKQNAPVAEKTKGLVEREGELVKKLEAFAEKAHGQISRLDNEPEMKKLREVEIPALRSAYFSHGGVEGKNTETLLQAAYSKMIPAELRYCTTQSGRYAVIMGAYWRSLAGSVEDFNELDRIEGELEKSSTGLDRRFSKPGLHGLEALKQYLGLLERAYTYDLYPGDRDLRQ